MEATTFEGDARVWAQEQFGRVQLGDVRLERRVVEMAAHLAQKPAASLPQQMGSPKALKAAYRVLDNAQVSQVSLEQAHWERTRQEVAARPIVLLVQDGTELDYTHYARTMQGLAPIGDGRGWGLLLHTTLAVDPDSRQVLGLMHQQVFERKAQHGAPRRRRPKAERESRVWCTSVQALGPAPAESQWVVVADRAADNTAFLLACRVQGLAFLVRFCHKDRVMCTPQGTCKLLATVGMWQAQVSRVVEVAAHGAQKARQAHVQVSFGPATLRVPKGETPLEVWGIHAWEDDAPPGVEALEWFLASSLPVLDSQSALQRLDWYTARWLAEDYHQCLKTGCALEERDLEQATRIKRLLGFLAVVAVRLLQLRQDARWHPDTPACQVADGVEVALVAAHSGTTAEHLSARQFWRGVAALGGFLGRRRDGDPGWKTLWRGWQTLQLLAQGVRLAGSLASRTDSGVVAPT